MKGSVNSRKMYVALLLEIVKATLINVVRRCMLHYFYHCESYVNSRQIYVAYAR